MRWNFLLALTALSVLLLPPLAQAQDEAMETLDTLVVTATRTTEKLREVTSNVTVIDSSTIKKSTAKDMADLMSQNGFQVTNNGPTKMLKIRGMGQNTMGNEMTSNILVLLNGRRTGNANMALWGLDNVERIEIIRGPAAVQYGPSAMGGVVNIITKRGTEDIEASMEVGFGSNGLDKEAFSFSGASGAFDLSGAVSQMSKNDVELKDGKTWQHTKTGSTVGVNVDMGYTFNELHRLGVDFNYYADNGAELPVSGWLQTGAIGINGDYSKLDKSNYNLGFSYEGATEDEKWNWLARYSFGKDDSETKPYANYLPDTAANYFSTIDNQSLAAQLGYNGEIFSLSVGADYMEYDLKGTYDGEASYEDLGAYISGKVRLFDEKLILSAGGRYDSYDLSALGSEDSSKSKFTPSVGVSWLPLEWLKFRANYSEGFKMPEPKQLGGSTVGWRRYIGNPALQPEASKTYELGTNVNWEFIDAGLTYFHTSWENKIVGQQVAGGDWQFQNIDASTIEGLEFSFSADLGEALEQDFELSPYVNLTWMMTRKTKDAVQIAQMGGDTLLDIPEWMVSYGLNFNYPAYTFSANLNASYYGSTQTAYFDRNYNTHYLKSPCGTVVDLGLEKGLLDFAENGSLSLRAELNNMFDDRNESYLDYPGPGRNFYLGLRYNY